MAPAGPPKVMKVRDCRSPRLKPGVKTAPLTPGFSPGLLGVTFAGVGAFRHQSSSRCPMRFFFVFK
jgi:hypothetical protein